MKQLKIKCLIQDDELHFTKDKIYTTSISPDQEGDIGVVCDGGWHSLLYAGEYEIISEDIVEEEQ